MRPIVAGFVASAAVLWTACPVDAAAHGSHAVAAASHAAHAAPHHAAQSPQHADRGHAGDHRGWGRHEGDRHFEHGWARGHYYHGHGFFGDRSHWGWQREMARRDADRRLHEAEAGKLNQGGPSAQSSPSFHQGMSQLSHAPTETRMTVDLREERLK